MNRDRLEAAWARLLYDQKLTPDEQRELVAGLEADPELRESLLEDALVDGWLSGLGSGGDAFVERINDCLAAEHDATRFLKKVESRIVKAPRRSQGRREKPAGGRYLLFGALAAVLLVAVGLFFASGPEPTRRRQAVRQERLAAIEREREQLVEVEREALARREGAVAEKARRAKEALQAERETIEREMREAVAKAREGLPPAPVKPPEAAPVPQPPPPPARVEDKRTVASVAKLERVEGEVFIRVAEARRVAKDGDEILPAQGVETVGATSRAVLSFGDKTRVEIGPATLLRELKAEGGKRVVVGKGSLRAEVSRQPKDQPMVFATADAEVIVVGTTLRVLVEQGTRLDVEEGKVQLKRLSDAKTVDVVSGHFAVAAVGVDFAVKALPRVIQMGGGVGRKAEDTLLYGFPGFENANYGGRDRLRISAGAQGACALIRFPGLIGSAAGQIPPKSTIDSATLKVHSVSAGPQIALRLRFHRCLKAWSEGRGRGEADAAQHGEASWSAAQKGILLWESPGARGGTDRSSDLGVAPSRVDGSGFVTFDITPAVQAWANGDANHGLVLDAAPGELPGELSLSSSEDAVAGNRPLLTVTFSAPAGHR